MIPSNEAQKMHGQDKSKCLIFVKTIKLFVFIAFSDVPLVMLPAVLSSTAMFVPTNVNLPQFYCLPQNIE